MIVGCGSITGLPSHGGGKRFAIEQELITKAVRNTIRDINLDELRGEDIYLEIDGIDDTGAGTLSGGRFSLEMLSSLVTSNSPYGVNTSFQQPSEYSGSPSGSDIIFLKKIIEQELRLKGLRIKNTVMFDNEQEKQVIIKPKMVELIILCDVVGLIRQRNDIIVSNTETYKILTIIRASAFKGRFDDKSDMIIPLRSAGYEATYNEEYMFWSGPIDTQKMIKKIDTDNNSKY
jgi:hypothetical protein